jgi:hypothetical protein
MIKAVRFVDMVDRIMEISDFVEHSIGVDYSEKPAILKIYAPEGTLIAKVGEYVIKNLDGSFRVVETLEG